MIGAQPFKFATDQQVGKAMSNPMQPGEQLAATDEQAQRQRLRMAVPAPANTNPMGAKPIGEPPQPMGGLIPPQQQENPMQFATGGIVPFDHEAVRTALQKEVDRRAKGGQIKGFAGGAGSWVLPGSDEVGLASLLKWSAAPKNKRMLEAIAPMLLPESPVQAEAPPKADPYWDDPKARENPLAPLMQAGPAAAPPTSPPWPAQTANVQGGAAWPASTGPKRALSPLSAPVVEQAVAVDTPLPIGTDKSAYGGVNPLTAGLGSLFGLSRKPAETPGEKHEREIAAEYAAATKPAVRTPASASAAPAAAPKEGAVSIPSAKKPGGNSAGAFNPALADLDLSPAKAVPAVKEGKHDFDYFYDKLKDKSGASSKMDKVLSDLEANKGMDPVSSGILGAMASIAQGGPNMLGRGLGGGIAGYQASEAAQRADTHKIAAERLKQAQLLASEEGQDKRAALGLVSAENTAEKSAMLAASQQARSDAMERIAQIRADAASNRIGQAEAAASIRAINAQMLAAYNQAAIVMRTDMNFGMLPLDKKQEMERNMLGTFGFSPQVTKGSGAPALEITGVRTVTK